MSLHRLRALLLRRSYREGDFVLASGARATRYIDCRQSTLSAEGHALVGALLLERIRAAERRGAGPFAAVGGMALGAAPIASAVALRSFDAPPALDAFLVRKEAKDHGTASRVEGVEHLAPGAQVVVVEDVVTSGGSALRAIEAVEAAGLRVGLVLCLVDREEGGAERIQAQGLPLERLFTLDEIAQARRAERQA